MNWREEYQEHKCSDIELNFRTLENILDEQQARIEELEKQIELTKWCGNCEYDYDLLLEC